MIRTSVIALLAVVAVSCSNASKETERTAVAQVGDRVLYLDDLPPNLVVPGMSAADSTSATQSFIRRWARKELLALKAEQNLTPEYQEEVNRQMDEMRNNLLIYQYQQQMIIQKMDTAVTDSEIEDYYLRNINTFTLTVNLVKALYIKLPADAADIDKVRQLYRSSDPGDMKSLADYCTQYALRYDDFDDQWLPFTQLLMEVPLESENQEEWLKRNHAVELKDDRFVYFILIKEYQLRNSVAPFDYIRGQVRTIILNNRRNDFLQKLEDGIYNEAVRDNTLKIY
jgi:hypothetical protein